MIEDPYANVDLLDDAVTQTKELMRDTFGDFFKQYYEGDPIEIPKANLPCLIVEQNQGNVNLAATGMDRMGSQINVRVVLDKSEDYGANEDTDMTEKKIRRLILARHPQTREYMPKTVLGVLRTKITFGTVKVQGEADVRYDLQPRPGGVVTSEGLVQIIVNESIPVPNRT